MTCRFPGCDEPAHHCDIDHTIAYPAGPTQASNLKCLCRKHHLLKTFGGWHDQQLARRHRGMDLTARAALHHPPRQPNTVPHPVPTHRTRHHVDAPQAPPPAAHWPCPDAQHTRAQNRTQAINDERRHNQSSSKPRQKHPHGNSVRIPRMPATKPITPPDHEPRATTIRRHFDGSRRSVLPINAAVWAHTTAFSRLKNGNQRRESSILTSSTNASTSSSL